MSSSRGIGDGAADDEVRLQQRAGPGGALARPPPGDRSLCRATRQASATSSSGWATLVRPDRGGRGGVVEADHGHVRPGTRPRAVSSVHAPSAIVSLTHTNAVGGLGPLPAAWRRPPGPARGRPQPRGTARRCGRPAAWQACSSRPAVVADVGAFRPAEEGDALGGRRRSGARWRRAPRARRRRPPTGACPAVPHGRPNVTKGTRLRRSHEVRRSPACVPVITKASSVVIAEQLVVGAGSPRRHPPR